MAETLEASTEIKSSPDNFFNFFKTDTSKLVSVFPVGFNYVELIQGEEGVVGTIKLYKYVLGGISLSVTLETIAIDDVQKSITFKVIEGDLLLLYKSYQFTIAVSDGLVKWTIIYEKAFVTSIPPDAYAVFDIALSKAVDLYLLTL